MLLIFQSVQHLPWESIPILSERSVSRMPCLSHLIMQLADHQTQKHSVFIKGVNPKNTFYILNPDSDLPRTQDFFKDWFERLAFCFLIYTLYQHGNYVLLCPSFDSNEFMYPAWVNFCQSSFWHIDVLICFEARCCCCFYLSLKTS